VRGREDIFELQPAEVAPLVAGAEVVDEEDVVVAAVVEGLDGVASDEACAAGDDDGFAHDGFPWLLCSFMRCPAKKIEFWRRSDRRAGQSARCVIKITSEPVCHLPRLTHAVLWGPAIRTRP